MWLCRFESWSSWSWLVVVEIETVLCHVVAALVVVVNVFVVVIEVKVMMVMVVVVLEIAIVYIVIMVQCGRGPIGRDHCGCGCYGHNFETRISYKKFEFCVIRNREFECVYLRNEIPKYHPGFGSYSSRLFSFLELSYKLLCKHLFREHTGTLHNTDLFSHLLLDVLVDSVQTLGSCLPHQALVQQRMY